MDPEYYQEYFHNERSHWWFRAREAILCAQVERLVARGRLPAPARILNIGAATGRSSEWLGQFGAVTSLEYDLDCCRMTRDKTGLEVIHGSILDLPCDDVVFDLVCAFDVIEHVEDHETAVAEMRRVTRPDGVIFVTVPAYRWLWSEHDDINHHCRRYSRRQLVSLFRSLPLCFVSGFNSLLLPPIALHRLLRKAAGILPVKRHRRRFDESLRSDFSRSRSSRWSPLLERIFRSERCWLDRGWPLPFGVSLMLVARNETAGGR